MDKEMIRKRITELRQKRGLSQTEFAKRFKVARSTVAMWETGDRVPDTETIGKLAEFFGVSSDYLLGLTNDPTPRPRIDFENDILEIDSVLRIPLLGYIAAGNPIFADEHIEDWIEFPNFGGKYKPGELFALRVKGDSMIGSRIYPGDVVIVRMQDDVDDGDIAVVNVDGENATLKRVKKVNGQYILYPDNPNYQPIVIDSDRARICGKVVKVFFEPNNGG
ncbi:MAG TPA: LexA family transcriptional regulator [Haloplasmataceae bacterium]